jgi:uncharacterized protein (DUF1800 family)
MKRFVTIDSSRPRDGAAMPDDALIAHLLRRTGFGPHPGQVASLAKDGYGAALATVLKATPLPADTITLGEKDNEPPLMRWYMKRLSRPDAGLHEKMVWFWHGHLTSSLDKADPVEMLRHYELLSKHALGNMVTFLKEISIDAAMLNWLDGNGSESDAPNENYGRELLELFALGRTSNGTPNYTEADVRAVAYAVSGYIVDDERKFRVGFHSEVGPQKPVELFGRQVKDVDSVIEAIATHAAFAPYITQKIYTYFHGVRAAESVLAELAGVFQKASFDIKPLVDAVLRHPSFVTNQRTRARFPIEWVVAANAVLGRDTSDQNLDETRYLLETLGQVPLQPPNVAGWPISPRWLSAGATMTKTAYAWDRAGDTEVVTTPDPVAWVLERASIYDPGDSTRDAMTAAATRVEARRERATVLHALALASPEFTLA